MTVTAKIKLVAAVAIVAVMAGLWLYAGHLSADRDRLAEELTAAEIKAAGMSRELAMNHLALQQREAEKGRLANENAYLLRQLNEVYANDSEARAWADTLCPSAVLECLLQ